MSVSTLAFPSSMPVELVGTLRLWVGALVTSTEWLVTALWRGGTPLSGSKVTSDSSNAAVSKDFAWHTWSWALDFADFQVASVSSPNRSSLFFRSNSAALASVVGSVHGGIVILMAWLVRLVLALVPAREPVVFLDVAAIVEVERAVEMGALGHVVLDCERVFKLVESLLLVDPLASIAVKPSWLVLPGEIAVAMRFFAISARPDEVS